MSARVKRWSIAVLTGAIVAAGAAAFAQETIKIGAFGPLTGDAAANGQSMKEAIDLLVDEVNAAGGVLGKKVQVMYGDDAGKPEQAVSLVKSFITRDQVVAVVGSVSSPASIAAMQVTWQEKVPHITVSATAARMTLQGNPWIFRSAVPDTKLAGDLAEFVHHKFSNVKHVAAINVNDDFGRGGVTAFSNGGKSLGMEVVVDEKYNRGDVDFTAQLTKIRGANPDALLNWSRYTDGALVEKQIKQMGMKLPTFGGDGWATPKFVELGGDAVEGVYYATHFSPATSANIPEGRKLIEKVRAKYHKDPDYVHSEAYDAMRVVLDAIQRTGSLDRQKIRDAMAATDLPGTRGRIRFDKNGDPTFATHIVQIVNGKEVDAREGK